MGSPPEKSVLKAVNAPPVSPAPAGLLLRHRPESLQGYVAQVVLRRLSDAEMGIDLRDRRLSDSDRRFAFPVVVPWVRELIRSLGNRTGTRQVKIGLTAAPKPSLWRREGFSFATGCALINIPDNFALYDQRHD